VEMDMTGREGSWSARMTLTETSVLQLPSAVEAAKLKVLTPV